MWNFVYEEEMPDTNGYCCAGIINEGTSFLFFTVGCDDGSQKETCRVYSSITFSEASLECEYEWTAENDALLLDCLNSLDGDDYWGEDSPIHRIEFKKSNN